MGGGKFLEASQTPETEHCVFSSPERQVGILRTIVQPAARWNTTYLQRAVDHLRDQRGEDTKRNLKHAKRLRRSYVPGCGAAEIDLDRGSAMFPSGNRR